MWLSKQGHMIAWGVDFITSLTPGVNFINVKLMNFSYERRFGNIHVTWKKLPKPTVVQKIRAFNIGEIDGRNISASFINTKS